MQAGKEFQEFLQSVITRAHKMEHEYYTPEHFLYEALKSEDYSEFFNKIGINKEKVINLLDKYFKTKLDKVDDTSKVPEASDQFDTCIAEATENAQNLGKEELDVYDVLYAIMKNEDTYSFAAVSMNGLDEDMLDAEYENTVEEEDEDEYDEEEDEDDEEVGASRMIGMVMGSMLGAPMPGPSSRGNKKKKDPHPALTKFSIDLTQEARDGKLMPIIGRDKELESTIQTLCRKTKNNPVYVGDPGVGKTAVVEALAQEIVAGNVPDAIKDHTIFSIEMGSLVAGTQYRGQFEQRIKAIVDEAKKIKNCILFIDEVHTVVGAGGGSNGAMDAANILKPALARGQIKVIGATTYDEYKKVFEKDKALARRFQKVEILEPTRDDSLKIIEGIAPKYEDFHGITYDDDALVSAVDLSIKYITDRKLPDKAIDVIDEAGSYAKIHNAKIVGTDIIKMVTSKISKVPLETMSQSESDKLKSLNTSVKAKIFGQDEAVDSLIKAIKKAKAGFKNPDKPDASFLFVGPTGVGKTELCKVISEELNEKLLRFDMSEYQEENSVSKLIGSSAGYVGYEEGGILTEAVRKDPHSIILLDEIEKAHRKVYNMFLQIMDYGTLTDNQGRKIDFRNTILIMTSNVGATAAAEHKSVGFGTSDMDMSSEIYTAEINKTFPPEFRNRLDGILMFNSLSEETAISIVKAEVNKVVKRMEEKGITLNVSDAAIDLIMKKGYSKEFGGRNIAKTAENLLAEPLIDEILFGNLKNGGTVNADVKDDKIVFNDGTASAKKVKKHVLVEA